MTNSDYESAVYEGVWVGGEKKKSEKMRHTPNVGANCPILAERYVSFLAAAYITLRYSENFILLHLSL